MVSSSKVPSTNVSYKRVNVNLAPIIMVFIYIFALVLNVLDQLVQNSFDFAVIGTDGWWSKTVQSLVLNTLILLSTLYYLIDRLRQRDPDINALVDSIKTFVDTTIEPQTFDVFMFRFNRHRKIKRFRKHFQRKLDKLNNHRKEKDIQAWKDEIGTTDRKQEVVQNDHLSSKRKYCRKRALYELYMTPEYIRDNIDNTYIRYRPVHKSFVTGGYQPRRNDEDNYYIENATWKIIKDLFPKVLLSLTYVFALNTIVFELIDNTDWLTVIASTFLKLVAFASQIYIAATYSNQYKIEKIMVDLRTRNDILILYGKDPILKCDKLEVEDSGRLI